MRGTFATGRYITGALLHSICVVLSSYHGLVTSFDLSRSSIELELHFQLQVVKSSAWRSAVRRTAVLFPYGCRHGERRQIPSPTHCAMSTSFSRSIVASTANE
jgi:hypothetical protein